MNYLGYSDYGAMLYTPKSPPFSNGSFPAQYNWYSPKCFTYVSIWQIGKITNNR